MEQHHAEFTPSLIVKSLAYHGHFTSNTPGSQHLQEIKASGDVLSIEFC